MNHPDTPTPDDIRGLVRPDHVHRRAYADAAVFALEQERIFSRLWIYVAHESQLKKPGDFVRTRLSAHEYPRHVGWGHSCIEDVIAFTRKAGVDNLVLSHHDPYHNDDELEALLAHAQSRCSGGRERVYLAQEGMTITLDTANGVLLSS